ncbi:MAG: SDR family NAD(P)-dependent oxidoreductase [Actinomycetota bacterium]|nr:SDR family NAD(P)-dependent oxidoreductase [Actinomycetota bacterium]
MATGQLDGKVALVAGAGRGIGRACALALAEWGASVVCLDSDTERGEAVAAEVAEVGPGGVFARADVLDRASVRDAVGLAGSHFGALDIAVDIVGLGRFKSYLDFSDEDFDDQVDINLRQLFIVSQECLGEMVRAGRGGSFVAISSTAGLGAMPHMAFYAATKAAVMSLVRTLAVEMGPHGIRVNGVAPGSTRTPRTAFLDEEARLREFSARVPLGRRGLPEEQAAAVRFLASDQASYMTGQTLVVDGGSSVQAGRRLDEMGDVAVVPWRGD